MISSNTYFLQILDPKDGSPIPIAMCNRTFRLAAWVGAQDSLEQAWLHYSVIYLFPRAQFLLLHNMGFEYYR